MGFQQGLSGLNAAAKNLDAIGNNVANAGTVGFKTSQAQFADVYAASLSGGGAAQVGLGTKIAAVTQQFTQGNITASNNPLDVAINGGGFFRLNNNGAISYTRNGQFQLDKDGFIATANGAKVTGYGVDPASGSIIATNPAPLAISSADLQPQATGGSPSALGAKIGLNVDSRSTVPATSTFSPTDPTSYNNSTSLTVYDTLGNPHVLSLYFTKNATAGTWDLNSNVDGAGLNVPSAAAVVNTNTLAVGTAGSAGITAAVAGIQAGATGWVAGMTPYDNATAAGTAAATASAAAAAMGSPATPAQINAAVAAAQNSSTATLAMGRSSVSSAMTQVNTAGATVLADGAVTPAQVALANTATASAAAATTAMAALSSPPTAAQMAAAVAAVAQASTDATAMDTTGLAAATTTAVNLAKAQAAAASAALTAAQAAQVAASLVTVPGSTLSASQLVFDTAGTLTTTMPMTITIDLAGVSTAIGQTNSATTPLSFNLDFSGTSQYGSPFGVNTLSQDGYSSGRLNGFNIGSDGVIQGRYSNGQSRNLGQLVLANFTNPQGLKPLGNNQWAESPDSNQPLIGTPGSGSLGVMQSAAVEESNTDLTAELVAMITAQRVYQANAQTIKTQDAVLQTIVNLR